MTVNVICFIIGLYLLVDSVYVASKAPRHDKLCTGLKYTMAFMSAWYLLFTAFRNPTWGHLLHGSAISLFMWPDTFYRFVNWCESHAPKFYNWLTSKVTLDRRSLR